MRREKVRVAVGSSAVVVGCMSVHKMASTQNRVNELLAEVSSMEDELGKLAVSGYLRVYTPCAGA